MFRRISKNATALMNRAVKKVFVASALSIIGRWSSSPPASFLMMLRKRMIEALKNL